MSPNNGGPGTPRAAAVKGEMPMSRASRGEKRYRFILILLVSVAVLFVGNFLIFVKTDVGSAQAVKTAQACLEEQGIKVQPENLHLSSEYFFRCGGIVQWRGNFQALYVFPKDHRFIEMEIPGYFPFWVTHVENGVLPTSEKENQRRMNL